MSKFNIPGDPKKAQEDARSSIEQERRQVDESGDNQAPNRDAAKGKSTQDTRIESSGSGTLLCIGRRSVGREKPITVFLDPDVRELLDQVIHEGSNKQLSYNELLRRSLRNIKESGKREIVTFSPAP